MNSVFITGLLLSLFFSNCSTESTFLVNPWDITVKDFEGWGTSLAWWADILGGLDDQVFEAVTDAFFSPDKLNLNIVRYVIGGTTLGTTMCGTYRPGAATESYKDAAGAEYNWDRDPRQRRVLIEAKRLGADTFEAFSNSPPDWMTLSGCSNGNGNISTFPLRNNMDASKAEIFAEYATDVIKHFHENQAITFQTYAPFNEAYGLNGVGGWTGPREGSQEGCNMFRSVMAEILTEVARKIEDKGMDYVTISAADETQVDTATKTQAYFREQNVSHLIEKINVHGYWDKAEYANRRDRLRREAQIGGHRLWMDEMGWPKSELNDMKQGLEVANRILRDFKRLLPSAWVYWQAMEDIGEWGLIGVPYIGATKDSIVFHSGYYSLLQFSKYIRKGYSIININSENSVAAYHAPSGTLVIVIINGATTAAATAYDLTFFKETSGYALSATRTSSTEQNALIEPPTVQDASFSHVAPPQSITTILFTGVTTESTPPVNHILNGNFEAVVEGDWETEGEDGCSGFLSSSFPWNGEQSGFLNSKCLGLLQTVKSEYSGTFYLTAWCASEGKGSELGVKINGVKGLTVEIPSGAGYRSYGIEFSAQEGDLIQVYYASPRASTLAYIDDVSLYYSTKELVKETSSTPTSGTNKGIAETFLTLLSLSSMALSYQH